MIQQVQNSCQFHGLPGDDANKHLDKFLHVTQSIKVNGVIDDALRLYFFPHSLTHHATTWFDHLLRNSINTFEQMAKMFLEKYFPTSMVTKLINEITNFRQRPMNHYLKHGNVIRFQLIDVQTTTCFPRNLHEKASQRMLCLNLKHDCSPQRLGHFSPIDIEDVQPSVVQSKSLILNSEPVISPIIEPVTSHVSSSRPNQRPSIPYPSRLQDQKLHDKANDQRDNFFQILKDLNFNISFADALILMPKFGPSIKSLLTNKDKLCELARTPLNEHCSAVLLKKLPENWETLASTFYFPADFIVVDFDADPRVPLILERSFLKTGRALIDVVEGELTLHVGKEAITFNLDQTSRYLANYNDMTPNRIDVIDMPCEEYSQEVLGFFSKLMHLAEVDQSYVDTEGDILLLEAFLNDDPSLPPPNQGNYLPEVRKELKICEDKSDKSSIDETPKVELKDLPPHLEYAFLEGDDKFPVIIVKDLSVEEKIALITVLNLHKRSVAWKLSDIKGIDPEFCTHKILMEEDFEPAVQHQRRANPKIHDVIKQEVLKLLDAGLIYPISDSSWVSPVHCVPKKGGFTVIENEENELILTRLVTRWRVYSTIVFSTTSLGYAMHQACFRERMLKQCEDTNLCLNWEKSHFMVKEGIVLGHKISKNGIEVDKACRIEISSCFSKDLYNLFVYFLCMSTRSSARNLFPPLDNPELTIRRRSRTDLTFLNNFEMAAKGNGDLPVPDLWTMEELCQPSLNGRGGPIAPIAIQETNFGLKNDMIQ
nr:reverse transcriptase domain-containing protein [Tanacetum cinerariifolium]